MKTVLFFALACFLLSAVILGAEDVRSSTGLGFHAGYLSSSGYSMRFFKDGAGIQGTIGAYATKKESAFNLGINGIAVLDEFSKGRFYVIGGGSIRNYSNKTVVGEEKNRWTLGAGLGLEWILSKNLRVSLELPITWNWKDEIIMWIPMGGLYYYLK